MKHRVAGRKLGRTSEHRLAVLRNLSTALFDKERIRTTLAKAKELRPFAEKLLTISKRETLHARRRVLRHIHDPRVVAKMFDTLSARYAQRPGGYTRVLKLGPRRGDAAEMAIIELVGAEVAEPAPEQKAPKASKARRGRGKEAEPAAEAAEPKGKGKGKAAKAPREKAPAKRKAAAEKPDAKGRRSSRATPKVRKGES
jgi:large subunit ribosomal protein L17